MSVALIETRAGADRLVAGQRADHAADDGRGRVVDAQRQAADAEQLAARAAADSCCRPCSNRSRSAGAAVGVGGRLTDRVGELPDAGGGRPRTVAGPTRKAHAVPQRSIGVSVGRRQPIAEAPGARLHRGAVDVAEASGARSGRRRSTFRPARRRRARRSSSGPSCPMSRDELNAPFPGRVVAHARRRSAWPGREAAACRSRRAGRPVRGTGRSSRCRRARAAAQGVRPRCTPRCSRCAGSRVSRSELPAEGRASRTLAALSELPGGGGGGGALDVPFAVAAEAALALAAALTCGVAASGPNSRAAAARWRRRRSLALSRARVAWRFGLAAAVRGRGRCRGDGGRRRPWLWWSPSASLAWRGVCVTRRGAGRVRAGRFRRELVRERAGAHRRERDAGAADGDLGAEPDGQRGACADGGAARERRVVRVAYGSLRRRGRDGSRRGRRVVRTRRSAARRSPPAARGRAARTRGSAGSRAGARRSAPRRVARVPRSCAQQLPHGTAGGAGLGAGQRVEPALAGAREPALVLRAAEAQLGGDLVGRALLEVLQPQDLGVVGPQPGQRALDGGAPLGLRLRRLERAARAPARRR